MDIFFKSKRLKSALEDPAVCRKEYGAEMAKKIGLRMSALVAAESLATFWPPLSGPERCHLLTADRAGTFSMDVKQPYRLLFVRAEQASEPEAQNEKERWLSIRAIEILGIEDTHG
jgi:plasmid maintenance system killer protein